MRFFFWTASMPCLLDGCRAPSCAIKAFASSLFALSARQATMCSRLILRAVCHPRTVRRPQIDTIPGAVACGIHFPTRVKLPSSTQSISVAIECPTQRFCCASFEFSRGKFTVLQSSNTALHPCYSHTILIGQSWAWRYFLFLPFLLSFFSPSRRLSPPSTSMAPIRR